MRSFFVESMHWRLLNDLPGTLRSGFISKEQMSRAVLFSFFLTSLLLSMARYTYAQPTATGKDSASATVYKHVDFMPVAHPDLYNWIQENIRYQIPDSEETRDLRVIAEFIVQADGSVTNYTVSGASGDSRFDRVVMTALQRMPRWTPGLKDGKAVACYYSMPIRFDWR